MEIIDKLKILSENSQYDLACACGTSKEDRRKRGENGWIYPVTLPNGGTSILLKTLMSNACSSDCKYCPFRNQSNIKRCSLSPDEICKIFMSYYKAKKVFGIFLSSGIIKSPEFTMGKLIETVTLLRKKYLFKGYVHLKIIPGASDSSIEQAIALSSSVSLNIETPGKKYFSKLSSYKDFNKDIAHPLKHMANLVLEKYKKVKLTTQFVVGAAEEPDSDILKYSFSLYDKLNYERIYFSAYQEVKETQQFFSLNADDEVQNSRIIREHRLYQSDFLIRKYGFKSGDFFFDNSGNLDLESDPKTMWANKNPEFYPININKASEKEILRIPGIGPTSAKSIMKLRKIHKIKDFSDIKLANKLKEKAIKFSTF